MAQAGLGAWLVSAGLALGCADPALDLPGARSGRGALKLELEPSADLAALPAVFRGRLQGAANGEPWLLRGELSDYHDRALRHGELSAALRERAVPLRFWRSEEDLWLQPLVWLDPDQDYTLGLAGYGRIESLRVAADFVAPERLFPAPGSTKHGLEVLCGIPESLKLPPLTLEPGGIALLAERGVLGQGSADCVTLRAAHDISEPVVAPPALGTLLLDPAAFLPMPAAPPAAADFCTKGHTLASACLEVQDDRVLITAWGGDALWLLQAPTTAQLSLRPFERQTLLSNLTPESPFELRGQVVSSAGEVSTLQELLTTQGPRKHLVINEVLANALGAEPASEWIEIVNDSAAPVSLAGVWLEDGGARVALPPQLLPPHGYALLVQAPASPSGLDVPFAAGAAVVELPSLGARGLSNSGEPLLLGDEAGMLSRFPLLPASHAGRSVARRALANADDRAESFAEHGAPGASPGAENTFD